MMASLNVFVKGCILLTSGEFNNRILDFFYMRISLWKQDLSSLWGKTIQLRIMVSSITETSLPKKIVNGLMICA